MKLQGIIAEVCWYCVVGSAAIYMTAYMLYATYKLLAG